MANFTLSNIFLTLGIVFLVISVLGQSKLGFIEINPGCFGRVLALIIGVASLAFVLLGSNFSVETIDLIRNYLAKAIQQNIPQINELLNS
ncbi:hypothetical protein ACX27_25400 [Nostoc piscinale CENA21]|uniref:Uncharacterized protein n=1 Tax=Nostoc piscinale CENA21 TaxID=224013 RepID=A0A0M4SUU1_9NOSO|nr:hypothetical protein [Nostoc piscinale]ALF55402.1 hypothetical protein ACX27_25400 [Nostoc piscinale CENA21]